MNKLAVLVMIGTLMAGCLPPVVGPNETVAGVDYNTVCYRPVGGGAFTCGDGGFFYVNDGAELVVASGGTLTVASGATANLAAGTFSNGLTVSAGPLLGSTTAITVTNGQTITPTINFYDLSAAGAVTITLAACANAGQVLNLHGNDAQTITIADSNILSGDGNAMTIGQYDVLALICNGSKWALIAKSANS